MEVGFSILKNEYIKANDCDYHSTTDFQIRCPFCFEPLFLKKGDKQIPHFSHYDISINAKTCELRAKKVSFYFSNTDISDSKGQTILQHYFVFANCFAIFMGLSTDIDNSLLRYGTNQSQIDEIKFYTLEQIKQLNKYDILPQDYLGKFIESNIFFYLYKLKLDNLIDKKNDTQIKNEFVNAFFHFSEKFHAHEFNFVEIGIEYRKSNPFYDCSIEANKTTNQIFVEEKKEMITQSLKYAFNKNEIQIIIGVLKLTEKNPCYCLHPNLIQLIENDFFATGAKQSISLKKILLFLGQDNCFLFKKKMLGPFWIGRLKDIDNFNLRLSLILSFSGRQTKDNPFYKNFPAITNKLILVYGDDYKNAKEEYLKLIKRKL